MEKGRGALKALRQALVAHDLPSVRALCREERRTLSYLNVLTYDSDPAVADAAVLAFGVAAEVLCSDGEVLRNHLRRLFWMLSGESGGIGWRAPEAAGEIIRACPEVGAPFIPLLIAVLDLEPEDSPRFRLSALRALTRLAEVVPGRLRAALPALRLLDHDPDVEVGRLRAGLLQRLE